MADDTKPKQDELPGNKGQFGAGDATEAYKPLENHDKGDAKTEKGPKQTNAGERS